MRRSGSVLGLMCLCIFVLGTGVAHGQPAGSIVGWGDKVVVEQSAIDDLVAVAAGEGHSLGLQANGTIVAWGYNGSGQCNVPAPNADFVALAGGAWHSLGLKSDGTIVAWGGVGLDGWSVPEPNANFVALAGGDHWSLGVRSSPVTAVEELDRGNMPGAAMLDILSVAPNPFSPSTDLSFEVRAPGHLSLEVYDVAGRRVRTLDLGYAGPGRHWARWDGRDSSGRDVASGVYFVRLRGTVGESRAVKTLLIR